MTCVVDPDPNKQVISLQMCGNGIVEAGEDCDPGTNVTSKCCDSATCKFTSGAICDPASTPCCTAQCSFAPSTQVCRPAKDTRCDFAENCTGNSSACPPDHFAPNGEYRSCSLDDEPVLQITNKGQSCGSGLNCASGQCTSLSRACSDLIKTYFDCWNGSPMSINWRFHGIKYFMSKSRGHILSGVMPGSHKG